MKTTAAASLLALTAALSACERTAPAQAEPPSQEEEIAEYCNDFAAAVAADPGSNAPVQMLGQRMIEEEWDPALVDRICAEALVRKQEYLRREAS